jgi:DNA polymerase-3 subunit epsilon
VEWIHARCLDWGVDETVLPMYMIIDCETTGLPGNWKAPISNLDMWPRAVQIAWSRYDLADRHVASKSHIIRPEGFTIPEAAQRVHRITTERALAEGRQLAAVLREFRAAANESEIIVAHNLKFDESVISAECLRMGIVPPFSGKIRVCTMVGTTEFCGIRGPYGYKWPSLSELYWKLFESRYEEAHDAGADVAACAQCFFELKKRHVFAPPIPNTSA